MRKELIYIVILTGLLIISCNDSFLDRTPETSITETNFFKSDDDLELYSNQFYGYFYNSASCGVRMIDDPSDNVVSTNTTNGIYQYMSGSVTPENVGKWEWGDIRTVNFMIARAGNATGENVNHYIGLARLTRALLYYNKVLSYSEVPWYSRDLQTTDDELLYKKQDSRALVCDSIVADLNYAIDNMKTTSEMKGDHTYLSKDVALAVKARICLQEASWRKYHPELGLNDADKFYEISVSACEQLMQMGYSLHSNYEGLFRNISLAGSPEVIFYQDYDRSLNLLWGYNDQFGGGNSGLSKDFFDTYLYINEMGEAVPFTSIPGFNKMSVEDGFKNRDHRLKSTFQYPGWHRPASDAQPYVQYLNTVLGYQSIKWEPMYDNENTTGYGPGNLCFGDVSKYRLGEILLIYAEAKAELGKLTQTDLDMTINKLRDRIEMPHAMLDNWLGNIDPVLNAKYPNVNSSQRGAVLEIRRERRVELAVEGFRTSDLYRWAMGKTFENQGKGLYVGTILPAEIDLTGDGKSDVAVVSSQAEKESYQAKGLTAYIVGIDNFLITADGYLEPADEKGRYTFKEPAYYYTPISIQDIQLNPNLVQNPYWK
ncbi:RagB/SusD family nutrient uptake outer membrane protein [Parabacteroides sp. APC149_11_2_Y6]